MNTWFEISFRRAEADYARKAATEAWVEIDRLESLLSRFREGSDVDILNKRASREPVRVTGECWDCLLQAMDLEILTQGAFCIAYDAFMDKTRPEDDKLAGAWLEMDPAAQTVQFRYPDIRIDLGGIGKGFALDQVVKHLEDWDLSDFIIHSGTSSVVARGHRGGRHGWPVSIGADTDTMEVIMVNESLSGSSLAVQDSHILDLQSREILDTQRRTWAIASSGAISDALSTSFMLMSLDRIEEICRAHPGLGALIVDPELKVSPQAFGAIRDRLESL